MDASELERETRAGDLAMREGRARFVLAVRRAYSSGMSQRAIALHSNRSQPEIRRLLKFHGTTAHGRTLRKHRDALVKLLAGYGIYNLRGFGSTALETDTANSDVDLLVTSARPLGLLTQARAQQEASQLLGLPVDLVFDNAIRPDLRVEILHEAVPL